MAAFETPWMDSVSPATEGKEGNGEPPTYATFSPTSSASSFPNQRSTILIHQKSPLLLATPPQITRALAYSHPFISPLNKFLGLLSWSTDDHWESFLLVAGFWAVVLYGDVILRWAGPPLLAVVLVFGLYARRFSPLSTTYSKTSGTHSREASIDVNEKNHKPEQKSQDAQQGHRNSLDEIVAHLQTFTQRCNVLLQPFLELTSFLSTQTTATSATTSPALTRLFIRLLFLTPIWYFLTLPPLRIITTKRVILSVGTLILSWHSQPARISRVILWRSKLVRRICSWITGLDLPGTTTSTTSTSTLSSTSTSFSSALKHKASSKALSSLASGPGTGQAIRFTFVLFENQRRWLGIGWTANMLAYERAAWTDEELNATEAASDFELPRIDGGVASWRWAEGGSWIVDKSDPGTDGLKQSKGSNTSEEEKGWVYTDTKWRYPVRGRDGWGKYTRRRKWVRDAELVDLAPAKGGSNLKSPQLPPRTTMSTGVSPMAIPVKTTHGWPESSTPAGSPSSASPGKKNWFGKKRGGSKESVDGDEADDKGKDKESSTFSLSVDRDEDEDDGYIPLHYRGRQNGLGDGDWGVGDELSRELG